MELKFSKNCSSENVIFLKKRDFFSNYFHEKLLQGDFNILKLRKVDEIVTKKIKR